MDWSHSNGIVKPRCGRNSRGFSDALHGERETTAGLQKRLRVAEDEVNRLGGLRSGLMESAESNRLEIGAMKKQLEGTIAELDRQREQAASYKSALQQANERINEQNVRLKKLADERNDAVLKYNKLVDEYTDLVKKWNEQQTALSPTNALPKNRRPHPVLRAGDLFHLAAGGGRARHFLQDIRRIGGPRRLVVGLEEEPGLLLLARLARHTASASCLSASRPGG